MKKLNKSGLAPVIIVVLILLAAGIGFAGYRVYQNSQKKPKNQNTQTADANLPEEVISNSADNKSESDTGTLEDLKPNQSHLEELYYGNVAQFEYERDKYFYPCIKSQSKDNDISSKQAESICRCTFIAGAKKYDGIVKFVKILNKGSEDQEFSDWTKDVFKVCTDQILNSRSTQ